jgi:hypothetical protein
MSTVSTGSTNIAFGSNLRIGYKIHGSAGPFTYLTTFPSYDELPYEFTLSPGLYDIEYSQVCPTCTTPSYSDAVVTVVNVT